MTLSRGAFLYLNLASHSLVHLDINGCGWLDNLDFVQELPQLRCLSLRGCTGLRSESLAALACPCEDDAHDDAHTGRRRGGRGRRGGNKGGRKVYNPPPRLEALDLSDCAAVDDAAGPHLARLPRSLRSLNLSGCGVGNLILDYLTYRGRLTMWRRERGGVETPSGLDDGCTATDLRLRRTRVSDAGLVHLKTLGRDVELLDLSECAGVSAGALAELAGSLGMSTSTSRPGVLVGVGAEEDRDACACAGACESSNVANHRTCAIISPRSRAGRLARVPVRGAGGGDTGGGPKGRRAGSGGAGGEGRRRRHLDGSGVHAERRRRGRRRHSDVSHRRPADVCVPERWRESAASGQTRFVSHRLVLDLLFYPSALATRVLLGILLLGLLRFLLLLGLLNLPFAEVAFRPRALQRLRPSSEEMNDASAAAGSPKVRVQTRHRHLRPSQSPPPSPR